MKSGWRFVFLTVFTVLLILSLWKITDIQAEYETGEDMYESLDQYVIFPDTAPPVKQQTQSSDSTVTYVPPVNTPAAEDPSEPEVTLDIDWPKVDFEKLTQINPDIIGWLYVVNTDISYPLVQSEDNDYYLTHLFDGTYNSSGSIFLDSAASPNFTDQHSVIYGHNMRNNTMFASLMNFKDPAYFEAHQEIQLMTPTRNYLIHVFSGHLADPSVNAWEHEFDEISFDTWLTAITDLSVFQSSHLPESDDTIVSLSTCTYEYDDAMFLLHGYIAYAEDCGK